MTTGGRHRASLCFLLAIALGGVVPAAGYEDLAGGDIASQGRTADLVPVPAPELADVDRVVADQLAEARRAFEEEVSSPGQSDEGRAESYGVLGQLYHAYELLDAARASYLNAVALAPADARWRHLLADVLRRQGLADAAAEQYLAASTLDPLGLAAMVRLGEVRLEVGRLDEAEEAFRAAAPSALAGLGQVALARRDYRRAATYLEAALRAVPGANRLHYSLAMAYRGMGELELAERHLELRGTVGLRPPDPLVDQLEEMRVGERVHLVRGRVAFSAGRFEEAAALFGTAVRAEPTSVRARVNLGAALARTGDLEGAVEQLVAALELAPGHAAASFNLGSLLLEAGRPGEAVGHLHNALRDQPEDAEGRLLLARALAESGEDEASLEHYQRAAALDPGSEAAVLGGAAALVRLGRFGQARSVLEAGHRRLPEDVAVAFALGRILAACPDLGLRDGARALGLAVEVYEAAPTPRHAQLVAQALAEFGRCEEAVSWQRQVVEAALAAGEPDVAGRLSADLEHYRTVRPCRPPGALPAEESHPG